MKCRSEKISCKISKIMLDKWRTRVYNSQHKATASLSNGAQRRLFLFYEPILNISYSEAGRGNGVSEVFRRSAPFLLLNLRKEC